MTAAVVEAQAAPRRRWGLWATVLLALALLVLLGVGMTRDPRALDTPGLGRAWPERALPLLADSAALGAAGSAVGPAQLRGKARLVNLWASWCATCQQEHPLLLGLAARLKQAGHGDQLVGLNYKDAPRDALAWLGRLGDPYGATLVDRDGRMGIDLGVYGAPENFVLDAQGVVRFKHAGPLTEALLREQVLPLLEAGR